MSSWERARHVPWDRIPTQVDGSIRVEQEKERIFRELQRETMEDELRGQESRSTLQSPIATTTTASTNDDDGDLTNESIVASKTTTHTTTIPFSNMELLKRAAFGGTIGSITGAVFGFMDGMRTASESQVLLRASNAAKFRFIMQGTTRSGLLFGSFFGGFHVTKYGIRIAGNDPGELVEIAAAAAVSMGTLFYHPTFRPSMPYAGMLIAMDCAQLYMRSSNY